jgi:protein-tyrosine phosphatase
VIDIHTHILPGIDDGVETIEESVTILKKASDEGVKAIVATSHIIEMPSESYWRKVNDTFNCVQQMIIQEKIDIEIILGAELFISPDLPQKIKENKGLTINSGNGYVLLELPVYEIPLFTDLQGIVPIIAHPERYVEIQKDTNKLFDLVKKGVLTQLNSGSLMGRYGKKAQKTAKTLLGHNLIHIIGSDLHSIPNGPYPLLRGVNIAAGIVGIERAKEMVTSIPEKVINGEKIDIPCPQQ